MRERIPPVRDRQLRDRLLEEAQQRAGQLLAGPDRNGPKRGEARGAGERQDALLLARVAQAQAALDLAKQNTTNAKIVAPFDGTVVWLGPHLGESAAPNAPMVMLSDLLRMQVQIGVDENTLAQLKPGQTAIITADALPGKTFTGHISRIGLQATTTAGIISLPVTIDVDGTDAPIAPGLSAVVEINTGK